MANYSELLQGNYYVIQEIENATLELVYIPLVTGKCVLVEFQDEDQTLAWYRKTDELLEIVEQLTDEQAVIYESLFDDEDDDDDDFGWGDDDDDDEFWDIEQDDDDEDDDDDDDRDKPKTIPINN
jgi:hypothetical protein